MTFDRVRLSPVSVVKVDGTALSEAGKDVLRSVEVELSTGAAGWTRLMLDVSRGDLNDKFGVGKKIEVAIKIGSTSTTIFKGEIMGIGLEVGDARILVVDAYEASYKLGSDIKVRTFVEKSDTDVLEAIAGECGLAKDIKDVSTTARPHRFQTCSNQELVEQICRNNGVEWRVDDNKLFVAKIATGGSATPLVWGYNLLRLNTRYSAIDHAKEVNVRGWDPKAKAAIVGTSTFGKSDYRTVVGLTTNAGSLAGARKAVSVRSPVDSQKEAELIAGGIQRRMTATAFAGTGECIGSPAILAGKKVKIENVGPDWEGEYYVTTARHIIDGAGFYRTEFQFGPLEPSALVDVFGTTRGGAADAASGFTGGVTIAIVTDNDDPDKGGRVKVKFPYLSDQLDSDWIRIVSLGGGPTRGILFLPEIDDEVLVAFEHGDIRRPYVLGGLWNGKDKLPAGTFAEGGKVVERVIVSRAGTGSGDKPHQIRMTNGSGPDKRFVSIELGDTTTKAYFGESKIEVVSTDKTIELKTGKASVLLDGGSGDITLKGANITIEAQQKITVKSGTDLGLEAGTNLKAKAGAAAEVKASAKMDLDGGGMLNVKGGMVKIN